MDDARPPCSVVLEGGVTSAVIYTRLLARLSRHYGFRQLGGASSGAIAAAAAAAAEYGRRRDRPLSHAFDRLDEFPEFLAATETEDGRTRLAALFQPHPDCAAALAIALKALAGTGRPGGAVAAGIGAFVRARPWESAGALALGLALLATVPPLLHRSWGCGTGLGAALACGTVALGVAAAGAVLGLGLALFRLVQTTLRGLRANDWGLCSGMPAGGRRDPVLTQTLHGLFQSLAGLTPDGPGRPGMDDQPPAVRFGPLTFGDLWAPPPGERLPGDPVPPARWIDLQIVTTSVSLQRPFRLPGDDAQRNPLHAFFYDPQEWARLLPEDVMAHLKACRRPADLVHPDDGRTLYALPPPAQMPVLLAARLSLSFPVLLSAMPMYTAFWRSARAGRAAAFDVRKVYFSDGGITSNCPVHLFDAPLPAFPTFTVNLFRTPERTRRRVLRSDTRDPELHANYTADAARWTTPLPFLLAIFGTMFGWRDSLQRSLPGYRERVVHVGVPPEAGGLNLEMTPAVIRRLGRLGCAAAERLHRDFTRPERAGEPNAWERHRWIRLRTMLSAAQAYLRALHERTGVGEPPYRHLVDSRPPERYPLRTPQARDEARRVLDGLDALAQLLDPPGEANRLDDATPQPLPKLHQSPPW